MDENGKEFWCFLEVQHGKTHCDAMGCNQCQPCEKYQRGDFRAHYEVPVRGVKPRVVALRTNAESFQKPSKRRGVPAPRTPSPHPDGRRC